MMTLREAAQVLGESFPISAIKLIKDISPSVPVPPLSIRGYLVCVKQKPLPPVDLTPNGIVTSPTPTLSWADPGAGKLQAADDFLVTSSLPTALSGETTKTSFNQVN